MLQFKLTFSSSARQIMYQKIAIFFVIIVQNAKALKRYVYNKYTPTLLAAPHTLTPSHPPVPTLRFSHVHVHPTHTSSKCNMQWHFGFDAPHISYHSINIGINYAHTKQIHNIISIQTTTTHSNGSQQPQPK